MGPTLINPGDIATPGVWEGIETGLFGPPPSIPMADIPHRVDYVLSCSAATTPTQIDLFQRNPGA